MLAFDAEWGIPLLLILVLVLFGAPKIPQLMRNLGAAQKEFKKGLTEGAPEDDEADKKSEKKSD